MSARQVEHDFRGFVFSAAVKVTRERPRLSNFFCHISLMRRQFMKEFRVCLNGGQHFCGQSGRITASGFPALMVSRLVPSTFAISL
jgi:hypothetical protein